MASTSSIRRPVERALSRLDHTSVQGDGVIYYPSGNMAVVVCKQEVGHTLTVMSDSASSQVLVCFDSLGLGGVNYLNGQPWLVVTEEGWMVSNKKGGCIEKGKHPRTSDQIISCKVSDSIDVKFKNKQQCTVTFICEDVRKEWQCGEHRRRTEVYTDKVLSSRQGKLELDVGAIRQRQRQVGSVYVPAGPHQHQSELPGVGSLRATLRSLRPDSPVNSLIQELHGLDRRLSLISTLPGNLMYSTAARASSASSSTKLSRWARSSGTLSDFGSPILSDTQKKLKCTMRTVDYSKSRHKGTRTRLEQLSVKDLHSAVLGTAAPRDTLLMLCILADWNPVWAKVESQAQSANHELKEESCANSSSPSAHVKMYKVDASESSLLQHKYHFRTVPMFLMFFEGKLVFASNNLRTKGEMKDAAFASLVNGRRREFLPDNFAFGRGADNSLLDYIKDDMTLRA